MAKAFASQADMAEKRVTFSRLSEHAYAFTAEGDPNTGIVVGDDAVMVIDTQATPKMAQAVIEHIRSVTDKPIRYVVLSHYHAVRVLGATAYEAQHVICSEATREMIVERGAQDYKSEVQRFPRLFQAAETIPGLTWPTITFNDRMTIWLGKLQVDIIHAGRGHTKGDTVVWLPEERTLFSGDLVEYGATPYAGDAHFKDWPETLQKLRDLRAAGPGARPRRRAGRRGRRREGHRRHAGIPGRTLQDGVGQCRGGRSAEASLRQGDGGLAAALRQLGDLRALPAIRRVARLRRSQGPRPSAHLDGRARPRDVGGAGVMIVFAGSAPLQWRIFSCSFGPRASGSLVGPSEPEARGPEDHERHRRGALPAMSSCAC